MIFALQIHISQQRACYLYLEPFYHPLIVNKHPQRKPFFERVHPQNLTMPLKNDGWKMSFLLGLPIFRGYVKFPGSNLFVGSDQGSWQ